MPHARHGHHAARTAYTLRSSEHAIAERRAAAMTRDGHRRTPTDIQAGIRVKLVRARVRRHQMRRIQALTLMARIGCTDRVNDGQRADHVTAVEANVEAGAGDVAYHLARNQVTMQRLRDRLAALEHVAEQRDRTVVSPGYVMHEDVDDHRITFMFRTSPGKIVCDLMTRHGFVFDPRRSLSGHATWGRKRTPTAIMVAQRLLPELNALTTVASSTTSLNRVGARRCRFALTSDAATLDEANEMNASHPVTE